MQIEINNQSQARVSQKLVKQVLNKSFLNKNWQVSVALVSPQKIKKINKIYRGKDKVTDVLSFCYESRQGELVLCYQQIKKQAKEHLVTINQELARMLIHGALHLQGQEDKTEVQAEKMRKLEDKILKNVKF